MRHVGQVSSVPYGMEHISQGRSYEQNRKKIPIFDFFCLGCAYLIVADSPAACWGVGRGPARLRRSKTLIAISYVVFIFSEISKEKTEIPFSALN